MLHHFEKYKNYQAPLAGTTYDKGYSFNKHDESVPKQQLNRTMNESIPHHPLIDNSFFDQVHTPPETKVLTQQHSKPKPTFVFQN